MLARLSIIYSRSTLLLSAEIQGSLQLILASNRIWRPTYINSCIKEKVATVIERTEKNYQNLYYSNYLFINIYLMLYSSPWNTNRALSCFFLGNLKLTWKLLMQYDGSHSPDTQYCTHGPGTALDSFSTRPEIVPIGRKFEAIW